MAPVQSTPLDLADALKGSPRPPGPVLAAFFHVTRTLEEESGLDSLSLVQGYSISKPRSRNRNLFL